MKTLTIAIDATTRKASVNDGTRKEVCPLKKEGNGTYSVVLGEKFDWPNKYLNVGALQSGVIVKREDQLRTRHTTPAATVTTVIPSKKLKAAYEVVKPSITADEAAVFEAVIERLAKTDELSDIDRKIAELTARKNAVK